RLRAERALVPAARRDAHRPVHRLHGAGEHRAAGAAPPLDARVRLRARPRIRLLVPAARHAPVRRLAPGPVPALVQHRRRAGAALRARARHPRARVAPPARGRGTGRRDRAVRAGRAHRLALDDRPRRRAARVRVHRARARRAVPRRRHALADARAHRGRRGLGARRAVRLVGPPGGEPGRHAGTQPVRPREEPPMLGITRRQPAGRTVTWTPPRLLRGPLRVPLFVKILVANSVIVIAAVAAGAALAAEFVRAQPERLTLELVGLVALAGVLASIIVNALIIRLALSPLDLLERTAEAVRAGDLDARAPISPLADRGLERLTRTFNAMLDGLEG